MKNLVFGKIKTSAFFSPVSQAKTNNFISDSKKKTPFQKSFEVCFIILMNHIHFTTENMPESIAIQNFDKVIVNTRVCPTTSDFSIPPRFKIIC